jgi:hypothetical protein
MPSPSRQGAWVALRGWVGNGRKKGNPVILAIQNVSDSFKTANN